MADDSEITRRIHGNTVGGPGISHRSPVHSPTSPRSGSDSDTQTPRRNEGQNDPPGRMTMRQNAPQTAPQSEETDRIPTRPGPPLVRPEQHARSADDVKGVHRVLAEQFTDAELKEIPVLPPGECLVQGAKYFDLRQPERGEITAFGQMKATTDTWYVPKRSTDPRLWDRLINIASHAWHDAGSGASPG